VQFKHLHAGSNPRLYNHYGRMASVVPLLNENHAYQGVAIVDINKVQQIAVGRNLSEALRQFQRLVGQSGDFAHLENARKLSAVEGLVDRVKQDLTPTGTNYYVVVADSTFALLGSTNEFPLLPLAQAGDRVKIEYVESGESVVPMHSFENLTLHLRHTKGEGDAAARKDESRHANEAKPIQRDLGEKLKGASPDQLRQIEEALEEK
jgi:hypothetical protein